MIDMLLHHLNMYFIFIFVSFSIFSSVGQAVHGTKAKAIQDVDDNVDDVNALTSSRQCELCFDRCKEIFCPSECVEPHGFCLTCITRHLLRDAAQKCPFCRQRGILPCPLELALKALKQPHLEDDVRVEILQGVFALMKAFWIKERNSRLNTNVNVVPSYEIFTDLLHAHHAFLLGKAMDWEPVVTLHQAFSSADSSFKEKPWALQNEATLRHLIRQAPSKHVHALLARDMYAMSTEKTAFVTWCLHGRLVQEINALTWNPLEPEEKYPLLIHAIVAHRSQHVQTLLQYPNIDVNLPDQQLNSPLMHAINTDQQDILTALMHHISFDAFQSHIEKAIKLAAFRGVPHLVFTQLEQLFHSKAPLFSQRMQRSMALLLQLEHFKQALQREQNTPRTAKEWWRSSTSHWVWSHTKLATQLAKLQGMISSNDALTQLLVLPLWSQVHETWKKKLSQPPLKKVSIHAEMLQLEQRMFLHYQTLPSNNVVALFATVIQVQLPDLLEKLLVFTKVPQPLYARIPSSDFVEEEVIGQTLLQVASIFKCGKCHRILEYYRPVDLLPSIST